MKSALLVLSYLLVALNAAVVNRNLPNILGTPIDNPPCSTNASSAYVDILLLIDTSAHMDTSNFRKISTTLSLVLSKFTIGQQFDITQGFRNTRIGVVTFDTKATIVANFTDINSVHDLATILNGLSASNSQEANLEDAIYQAFYLQSNCYIDNIEYCPYRQPAALRPTAMIVFAAAANYKNVDDVISLLDDTLDVDYGTIITVNFNTANQNLTNLLEDITWVPYINATMYNFISTSNTLTRDLEWAILQANCYCQSAGINVIYYDNGRYSRYAECLIMSSNSYPVLEPQTINSCDGPSLQVPAFVLSKQKEEFIQNLWYQYYNGTYALPFYFGLHQNNQSQWTFYNYDTTEFPVSSYLNWSPGYPKGTDKCAIMNTTDGATLVWQNYNCNTTFWDFGNALCQEKACDASNLDCCYFCMNNSIPYEKKQKIRSKYQHIRRMKMVNGKPILIA